MVYRTMYLVINVSTCFCRAEKVSKETDESQQYLTEVANHVRHGGRSEEDIRATVIRPLSRPLDNDDFAR
jgi:hypothetical protein